MPRRLRRSAEARPQRARAEDETDLCVARRLARLGAGYELVPNLPMQSRAARLAEQHVGAAADLHPQVRSSAVDGDRSDQDLADEPSGRRVAVVAVEESRADARAGQE